VHYHADPDFRPIRETLSDKAFGNSFEIHRGQCHWTDRIRTLAGYVAEISIQTYSAATWSLGAIRERTPRIFHVLDRCDGRDYYVITAFREGQQGRYPSPPSQTPFAEVKIVFHRILTDIALSSITEEK
jgi:hypothetical protein